MGDTLMDNVDQEVAFTKAWWLRCLADKAMMERWLIKLQLTEIDGYWDWFYWQGEFKMDEYELKVTTNIGEDELKHSNLLIKLMASRGISPGGGKALTSTYWAEVEEAITDKYTCFAVNHYGEALAAFRFEVIHSMPETDADIREVIGKILPDEQFHRQTLAKLAGDEALEKIKGIHEQAMFNLKYSK